MEKELIDISEDIFREIIAKLTLQLRFMDLALNRYTFVPDGMDYYCDGKFFHYSPIALIKDYQNNETKLIRGYLHVVLHSIYQHAYFANNHKVTLWNLASDIAVENVLLGLQLDFIKDDSDGTKKKEIERIKESVPTMSAQRIYHYLEDLESDYIKWLSPIFQFDQHDIWYEIRKVESAHETLFGEETKDNASIDTNNTFENASHDTGERKEADNPNAKDVEYEQIQNALEDWKEISEKLKKELEEYQNQTQYKAQTLVQSLKALRREKYNYEKFLRRFTQLGEKMMINDEDFEPIFYTYGLQLYKNLPLIEPLETKEVYNIKELVIAIDTSGSVQGDVVQSFLQKTYNIFQQEESFFSHFHIHIIQCDMEIQDVAIIQTRQAFANYIDQLELKGFRGTDFRPVFQYIQTKIERKQFHHLGGLLYFTDGDGIYPKTKPPYITAFLFPEKNKKITVPPWAIQYTLEGEEYAY